MLAESDRFRPQPLASALLGFLERVPPGARYAIAPLGRYTRACCEDAPRECFESGGRKLLGFIDDAPQQCEYLDHPVGTFRDAGRWPIDTLILTRDTHAGALGRRIESLQDEGLSPDVRIIDQPAQTLDAMLAHLGTYEPGCLYTAEFVAACRSAPALQCRDSTLLVTLDAEVFPAADSDAERLYPIVMREFTRLFQQFGFEFTLCVQLNDTPGGMKRTPPAVVEDALRAFGPGAIALHGLDHSMPSDGYTAEWFEHGLTELRTRYGVQARYWAPPGWTLNWRTLRLLQRSPIRLVRGLWTGVNIRRGETIETFRFPYHVGDVWQIPYAYADWMFADMYGQRCEDSQIVALHERLADFAAQRPCLMESVAHPFRLVGSDWRSRLRIVERTLECYSRRGVKLAAVPESLDRVILDPAASPFPSSAAATGCPIPSSAAAVCGGRRGGTLTHSLRHAP